MRISVLLKIAAVAGTPAVAYFCLMLVARGDRQSWLVSLLAGFAGFIAYCYFVLKIVFSGWNSHGRAISRSGQPAIPQGVPGSVQKKPAPSASSGTPAVSDSPAGASPVSISDPHPGPLPAVLPVRSVKRDWEPVRINTPSQNQLAKMLGPDLADWARKSAFYNFITCTGIFLDVLGLVLLEFFEKFLDRLPFSYTGQTILVCGVALTAFGLRARSRAFGDTILRKLVKMMSPSFETVKGSFPKEIIKHTLLISGFDRLRSGQLIAGTLGAVIVKYSEISAERRRNGGGQREAVFTGAVVEMLLPKPVDGGLVAFTAFSTAMAGPTANLFGRKIDLNPYLPDPSGDGGDWDRLRLFAKGGFDAEALLDAGFFEFLSESVQRFGDVRVHISERKLAFALASKSDFLSRKSKPLQNVHQAAVRMSHVLEFSMNLLNFMVILQDGKHIQNRVNS